jgi:hypothetical protein
MPCVQNIRATVVWILKAGGSELVVHNVDEVRDDRIERDRRL